MSAHVLLRRVYHLNDPQEKNGRRETERTEKRGDIAFENYRHFDQIKSFADFVAECTTHIDGKYTKENIHLQRTWNTYTS